MLTRYAVFDYTKCRQYHYAQDVHSFQRARFAYYLSRSKITPSDSLKLLRFDVGQNLLQSSVQIQKILESIERLNPTIFIITATHNHYSSDGELKKIRRKYGAIQKSFKTQVISKNFDEMLKILEFDFRKHHTDFSKFSTNLKNFMKKYSDVNGRVTLKMVHNAYIITKK